jgi:hypothetical protein
MITVASFSKGFRAAFELVKVLLFITFAGYFWTFVNLIVFGSIALLIHFAIQPSSYGPASHDEYYESAGR